MSVCQRQSEWISASPNESKALLEVQGYLLGNWLWHTLIEDIVCRQNVSNKHATMM